MELEAQRHWRIVEAPEQACGIFTREWNVCDFGSGNYFSDNLSVETIWNVPLMIRKSWNLWNKMLGRLSTWTLNFLRWWQKSRRKGILWARYQNLEWMRWIGQEVGRWKQWGTGVFKSVWKSFCGARQQWELKLHM